MTRRKVPCQCGGFKWSTSVACIRCAGRVAHVRCNGNALKTHCKRGHPLTDGNVSVYVRASGKRERHCMACGRQRNVELRERKKKARRPRPVTAKLADPTTAVLVCRAELARVMAKRAEQRAAISAEVQRRLQLTCTWSERMIGYMERAS